MTNSIYLKNLEKYENLEDFIRIEEHTILKESDLFDEEYYMDHNPEVKTEGWDPYNHYIHIGKHEKSKPNRYFDSDWYLNQYPDVRNKGIDPFIHYILWGNDEKRCTNLLDYTIRNPILFTNLQISNILENMMKKVSIIIPIYNAYEDSKKCIESVLQKTTQPYEIILINDNSTDKRINELLEFFNEKDNITVINNEINKGFVKNVNIGIKHSEHDVVLLNSDTVVTDKWLEKLKIAAYKNKNIGTVTPISNNAGAFSAPKFAVRNRIPNYLSLSEMANIVEKSSNKIFMETPTGNGFCMYIKRDTINSVGFFDEIFGKGYCEENDYCMRAKDEGWINIIDDHTYIFHNESSSFQGERQSLFEHNIKILLNKHPTYLQESNEFIESDDLRNIRKNVEIGLNEYEENKFNKKRILYVMHQGSGGTPETAKDLMTIVEKEYDCFLLESNGKTLTLSHFTNDKLTIIKTFETSSEWSLEKFYISEFRDIYFNILFNYSIDLVHIQHLIYHTFDLPIVANTLNIPIELSFHDFYFICPAYNLLDGDNSYCEAKCTSSNSPCKLPLPNITNITDVKSYVNTWRKEIQNLFLCVDNFITTSEIVKKVFLNTYPKMNFDNFFIIEHGRDFKKIETELFEVPSSKKPIKLLFIGNINNAKGSKVIKELYNFDKNNELEIHFLGNTVEELQDIGIHHGPYARDELSKRVEKIKPSFIGIFSICCESFCHTLTESWNLGIPVLSTKIGVQEDRMKKNNGGWFIDHNSPEKTFKIIKKISKNPKEYQKIQNKLKNINFKTTEEMGNKYLDLYEKSINKKYE